jgi:hypothetical protein
MRNTGNLFGTGKSKTEMAMAYFKVLFRYSHGDTEEGD